MLLTAHARSAIHARSVRYKVWVLLALLLLTAAAAIGWLLVNMRTGDQVEAQQRLNRIVLGARRIAPLTAAMMGYASNERHA